MSNEIVDLPGQETLLACWRALTQLSPGAELVELESSIAAVFPEWAPLNNAILRGEEPDSSVAEAAARRLYDRAGVPVWALWRPSRARDLDSEDAVDELRELKRDTTTLVMEVSLEHQFRRDPAVVPAPISVVAELDDDVRLAADAIGAPDDVAGLAGWVFVHDGLAVAAAWTYVHGTDCGVYGVETLTAYRRRGFAKALMGHVLADAYDRGARTATLQSTRMGQPLYESLGFVAVGRYEEWLWQ